MALRRQPINKGNVAGGAGWTPISASGDGASGTTTDWRIHIQNVEVMYERKWAYDRTDGTVDFTYIDANVTMETAREHIFANYSGGEFYQMMNLDLISDDSASGGIGSSGVIRTQLAGMTRREVRGGDVESRTRINTNVVTGRQPGTYNGSFDTSATVNTNILDILIAAKESCPDFEINLVDL